MKSHWALLIDTRQVQGYHSTDGQSDACFMTDHESASEQLTVAGYQGEPLVILLASSLCRGVPLSLDETLKKSTHDALTYQLETFLPWSAEEFTAAFVGAGQQPYAVAVENGPLHSLLTKLTEMGSAIEAIAPLSLLAIQELDLKDKTGMQGLLWQGEGESEWFLWQDGQLSDWRLIKEEQLTTTIQQALLQYPQLESLQMVAEEAFAENLISNLQLNQSICKRLPTQTISAAALSQIPKLLKGGQRPALDLLRGELQCGNRWAAVDGWMTATALLAILMVVSLIGAMFWRAGVYNQQARDAQVAEQTLFKEIFPQQKRIPTGIRRSLSAEAKRLEAMQGESLQTKTDSLQTLYHLLQGWPASGEASATELAELQISGNQISSIRGNLDSYARWNQISQQLQQQGFETSSPQMESTGEGSVSFNGGRWGVDG